MSRNWAPGNRGRRDGCGRGADNCNWPLDQNWGLGPSRGYGANGNGPGPMPLLQNSHTRYPPPSSGRMPRRAHRGNRHYPPVQQQQSPEIISQKPPKPRPNNRNYHEKTIPVSASTFYRIILHHCKIYEKVMLFTYITDKLERHASAFLPFGPKVANNNWEFLVNDHLIAQRIFDLSGKIVLPDGSKMMITVKPACPNFELDELASQAITVVLAEKYNFQTKEADLSKFQNNSVFVAREMLCSLNLSSVMVHVTDVLVGIAPDLRVINLSDNELTSLEETGNALVRFASLKVLNLSGNKIHTINEVTFLTSLKLDELDLRGNGLDTSYKFRTDYVTEIRALFPTLKFLDGEAVHAPIGFDLEESDLGSLPPWLQNFYPEHMSGFANGFVSLYFKYYDEPGRPNLMSAYHPDAIMSLLCFIDTNSGQSYSTVSAYQPHNRNRMLSGMREPAKSSALLYKGREKIVAILKDLPPTQHIPETFCCDLITINGEQPFVQIIITGLFKEFGVKPNVTGKPVKSFTRCFLILIQHERGGTIINDSLVIRYPTHSQMMLLKKVESKRNNPVPLISMPLDTCAPTTGMEVDEMSYLCREHDDGSHPFLIKQEPLEGYADQIPTLSPELQFQMTQGLAAYTLQTQPLAPPPALSPELKFHMTQELAANTQQTHPLALPSSNLETETNDDDPPLKRQRPLGNDEQTIVAANLFGEHETKFSHPTPPPTDQQQQLHSPPPPPQPQPSQLAKSPDANPERASPNDATPSPCSTPSSSTSSSRYSDKQNILVSHLVSVYDMVPENAESLLESFNWDLAAIVVAMKNK